MSIIADSVVVVAQACEVAAGNGLGDQYINPTGDCRVSAFHVQLSLAGGITDPFHLIFKVLMTITWAIYQFQVIGLAWVTDFVLGMTWLNWFTDVAGNIQDSIAGMLNNLDLYLTMLVVSAFICVIWMARGMWGKGILQLLISLIVANYAVAAISYDSQRPDNNLVPFNPISWVIGNGDEGLLYDARDTARYLVSSITNDDEYFQGLDDPEGDATTPGQSILDTFLYHPAMLVNFGFVLDGQCEEAYAITLSYAGNGASKDDLKDALGNRRGQGLAADGIDTSSELTDPGTWWGGTGDEPVDYDPEVWKVVGKCVTDDVDTFAKMARPDSWMAQFAIQPAVTILAVLILIIAGVVFIAGLSALVQCIKLMVTLLLAILPGGARSTLWRTLGQLFATVLMLIFCIVFLGVFLHVLTNVMAGNDTGGGGDSARWAAIGKFLLIDLMLVAGIVLFWRGRGAVHETKERMAAAMASKFDSGAAGGGGGGFGGGGAASGARGRSDGLLKRAAGNFHLASDVARDSPRLGNIIRRTGGVAGMVGLAVATGGGSLVAQGGMAAGKSWVGQHAGRAVGRAAANRASSVMQWARRERVKHHLARGNDAAVNRIETDRRRAETARTARADQARLDKFDRKTIRSGWAAKLTGGRRGAQWVNEAPKKRRKLVAEMARKRQDQKLDHQAQSQAEKERLTPEQRRAADEREQRLEHRDRWRQIREDQRRERRENRDKKKGR